LPYSSFLNLICITFQLLEFSFEYKERSSFLKYLQFVSFLALPFLFVKEVSFFFSVIYYFPPIAGAILVTHTRRYTHAHTRARTHTYVHTFILCYMPIFGFVLHKRRDHTFSYFPQQWVNKFFYGKKLEVILLQKAIQMQLWVTWSSFFSL